MKKHLRLLKMINNLLPDEILALTLWGEARGEPIEGQIAIANVIINRIPTYHTIKEVCLAPKQFSCWNISDVNYTKLLNLAQKLIDNKPIDDILKQCLAISKCVINREFLDNTLSSKNYMTNTLFNSDNKPSWAKGITKFKVIGNHTFFTA